LHGVGHHSLIIITFVEIHPNSLNPVWGPEHDSTFVLNTLAVKLVDANGLTFVVKDFDLLKPDDHLGTVQVALKDLVTQGAMAKTLERKITPPKGNEGAQVGYLTIRIRKATGTDEESLAKGEMRSLFEQQTGGFLDQGGHRI
jgi:C2 domain